MVDSKRVLLVEDDPEISKLLQKIITKMELEVVPAYSGTEGLLQLQHSHFDVILLDLMLPGMRGEEFITEAKGDFTTPIIVISAKVDVGDKVHVLKIGADDYMTKPFNQEEVMARIEVQLRKSNAYSPSRLKVWRDLKINPEKRSVSLENQTLQLTNAEYDILSLFVDHPEHAFSKKKIYESIWTGPYVGDDNTISVHVSNLRRKIANITPEEYIKTIWGIGFMLV